MYYLRELERRDLPTINKWRNDPELIALLGAPFRYINPEVDERWFESYMNNRGNAVRCAITTESDEILGLVSLTNVDYLNQRAEFHIMIGGDGQNQGAGTFAVTEMLHHAFYNMNLHRIELTVLEDNARARRVYEKCGFVYEGRKRQAVYKNGRFVDMLCYAALRDETGVTCVSENGGATERLPHWTYDVATSLQEASHIARTCNPAFAETVATHTDDVDALIRKVYLKGTILTAHTQESCGYCAFYANDTESTTAFISLIAVAPECQGRHIGAGLLDETHRIAAERGMTACELEVYKDNTRAHRFYLAQGYQEVQDRQNRWLMRRELLIENRGGTEQGLLERRYNHVATDAFRLEAAA